MTSEQEGSPRKVHERLDGDVVADLHRLKLRWDYRMSLSDVIRRLIEESA